MRDHIGVLSQSMLHLYAGEHDLRSLMRGTFVIALDQMCPTGMFPLKECGIGEIFQHCCILAASWVRQKFVRCERKGYRGHEEQREQLGR